MRLTDEQTSACSASASSSVIAATSQRARPPNGERPSLRNSPGSLSVHRLPQDLACTRARESRALTAAAQDHSRAVRRLLVLDRDALTRVNAPGVEVRPAYEWLLTTPNQG